MRKVWDKRRDESSKAFEAFTCYLTLGPQRSIARVAEIQDRRSLAWLKDWSSKYDWVARAEAFDEHELKVALEGRQQLVEHARQRLIAALGEAVDELLALVRDKKQSGHVRVRALQLLFAKAGLTNIDGRAAAAEGDDDGDEGPESIEEVLELLNDDELEELDALFARAAKRREENANLQGEEEGEA